MDLANLIIGFFMLIGGVLGAVYLIAGLAVTHQPQPAGEPAAYPSSDRFLVPLALPVGVLLAVAAVIFLFSQILLVVPEAVATPIALLAALGILGGCSLVALSPSINRQMISALVGLPLIVLVLAGGAAGYHRLSAIASSSGQAEAVSTSLTEVANDDTYTKTSFVVPAGQQVTIRFQNQSQDLHNWHVLDVKDDSGKDIVDPPPPQFVTPGTTATASFTISQPGTYHYQCDVHPTTMTGTLTVK